MCVCACVCIQPASAYTLPALNGSHSHTHFCLFSLFFTHQMVQGRGVKRRGNEGKWLKSMCTVISLSFLIYYFPRISIRSVFQCV